ncbi:unnamed protein product [Anisakis simplex]|uniref:SGS domain-containing protein n=1 Tax=Anisakis simplex TaxID=6269 RepID=A0A0M3KET1_ANISI|nr:unnamed protein product [Anisakis simplex]
MDDDLFGAFGANVSEHHKDQGASSKNGEDLMQKVERKRQEECRSNADAFLARMAAGEADAVNLKRHTDKDLDGRFCCEFFNMVETFYLEQPGIVSSFSFFFCSI